ncbi:MAG: hypothetical protein COW48_02705 [Hydrogenophilales bacterium CG17_big_fil_post_rev_8_21_14_2_50_63_12]|nr:hypothetical protein [Rhodobacterales bacterium]PIV89035.1 MAG: hypothetical protein COW48_02705 [Hydrogenophilales bacterium CG17_big_fil_post_rev_8_21_14_2_50_63_12]
MFTKCPMSQFMSNRTEATTAKEIQELFDDFCEAFELSYLTYYAVDAPMIKGGTYLITNYPESWKRHYFENGYQKIDPVLSFARNRLTPLDWHDLPPLKGPAEVFFSDARLHGLGSFGMTVPIRGQFGELALVSVNAETSPPEWVERWRGAIPDYTFFAYLLHMQVLRSIGTSDKPIPQLTRQEAEVMRWAVRGKSAWDTARLMGLTERTVHFYVRNICAKLEVATKTQAVARVVREHLIPL